MEIQISLRTGTEINVIADRSSSFTIAFPFPSYCLQCSDAVGWAAGRAAACKKWGMVEAGTG